MAIRASTIEGHISITGADAAERDVSGFGKAFDKAADVAEKSAKRFGKIGGFLEKSLAVFTGGALLGAVGRATDAVSGFLTDGFADARGAAMLLAQTEAVITSTGGAAGVTATEITDLASSLSDAAGMSTFGDDQIQGLQNLLLTFTNVKGEILEGATQIGIDMATALGTEPQAQAVALGKALNDPVKGITALTRVGVTFTQQQKDQIKAMAEAGNVAGAQAIILDELGKEFGGSAKAAAEAAGPWAQLRGIWGETAEGIASGLLPAIDKIGKALLSPAVQNGVTWLADAIVGGIGRAVDWLTGTAIPAVTGAVSRIQEAWSTAGEFTSNPFEQLLGTIGVLFPVLEPITTWLSMQLPRAVSIAQTAFNLVRDSVLTFVQALQGNWENSDKVLLLHQVFGELGLFISGTVVPAFQTLVGWLRENWTLVTQIATAVGIAVVAFQGLMAVAGVIGGLVTAWGGMTAAITTAGGVIAAVVGVLGGPVTVAIAAVAAAVGALYLAWTTDFLGIQTNLTAWWTSTGQPIFTQLTTWLATNIPVAIGVLVGFWNSTLYPALQTVGTFIQTYIVPAFVTLGQWLATNIPVAIQTLANFWTGTLQPAIITVLGYIAGTVIPALTNLATNVFGAVQTGLSTLATFWTGTLLPAITTVWEFINGSIVPLLTSLANVVIAALGVALTAMAGIWQNVVQPALQAVWDKATEVATLFSGALSTAVETVTNWFNDNLLPAITTVGNFFADTLGPAAETVSGIISDTLGPAVTTVTGFFETWNTAIGGVSGAVQTVINWLNTLTSTLKTVKLPAWMTPGSPTPWEIGMWGVAKSLSATTAEMRSLNRTFDAMQISAPSFDTNDPAAPWLVAPEAIAQQAEAVAAPVDAAIQTVKDALSLASWQPVIDEQTQIWTAIQTVIHDKMVLARNHLVDVIGLMRAAIKGLMSTIDGLINKINSIPPINGGGGGDDANNPWAPRALGGPVRAGMPYLVGERGPELFMPRMSGTIIPNDRTQSMLAAPAGNTFTGPITIVLSPGTPQSMADEFLAALEARSVR